MSRFPTHPDAVSPVWLTAVLRENGASEDARVRAVSWSPIGTGQVGDSVRFVLDYESGTGPLTLAGKFAAADPVSRATAFAFGLYRKEVLFYRTLAERVDVRVPQVLAAELDDTSGDFLLLFEDLAPCRQGDQVSGCGIEDARHAVRQAAALHAPTWNETAIVDADWLRIAPEASAHLETLYPQAQAVFCERYADLLEPELMDVCHGLNEARALWFDRAVGDRCLIHGDFRLDNLLFDIRGGREPIAVLDWQTVAAGSGLVDIGYLLGCGIGDELRGAHEDDLLDLYCTEMTARGVPLDRAAIRDPFRLGILHGVATAVFSAAFVERTPRGDANFLSMARGACAAARAHRSLDLLTLGR